jgi:hypothetical protein
VPPGPVTSKALVRPSSLDSTENSTDSPSLRDRKPSAWMEVWWTKRSSLPSSGVINPKPLPLLNHFTFPLFLPTAPPAGAAAATSAIALMDRPPRKGRVLSINQTVKHFPSRQLPSSLATRPPYVAHRSVSEFTTTASGSQRASEGGSARPVLGRWACGASNEMVGTEQRTACGDGSARDVPIRPKPRVRVWRPNTAMP